MAFSPTASWKQVKHILLEEAQSDILVVLDCCFAGNAFADFQRSERRVFEIMVATAAGALTARPGPHSFTTAMMRALRKLREASSRPISTWELSQTILKDAEGSRFSKVELSNLHPVILGPGSGHIMLAPPEEEGDAGKIDENEG